MEEIKAGDIMLGNWFIGYDDKPFQWDAECFYLTQGVVSTNELINKPIPLTEEILLKAGFEKDYKSFLYKQNVKGFRMRVSVSEGGFRYNISMFHNIQLEYIHQLQNLFKSLTGNDLKIEV